MKRRDKKKVRQAEQILKQNKLRKKDRVTALASAATLLLFVGLAVAVLVLPDAGKNA